MWTWRRRSHEDFAAEIRANIAIETDRLIANGTPPEEARAAAHRAFGNVTRTQERFYEFQRLMWLDDIARDVRHAWRTLTRNPGFAAIAVLTLAVGIAANTAVFSVADALLLRPLPYPDADRLVALRSINRAPDSPVLGMSSARSLADWQTEAKSFEAITGYRWRSVDLRNGSSAQRLHGLYVTPEYFDVFGITNVSGRTFTPADRGTDAIVLGRGIWEDRFSSNPSLVGSMLDVSMINLGRSGATPNVVLGVDLADAHFPPITADFNLDIDNENGTIDFWLPEFPLSPVRDRTRDSSAYFDVVGKLKPGVSVARAQAEMDAISVRLARMYPDTNKDWSVRVVPLRTQIAGGASRVVLLLAIGTGLVLLIACGNVATLLLVRGLARQREVAVRSALGASRARIARQFVIESLLISVGAAIIGVAGASAGIALLEPQFPRGVALIQHVHLDATVLTFVLAVAAITTCLTGLAPAWISSARGFNASGLGARGQTASQWQHRAIGVLTGAQVALTMVLLVSTGLLLRSASHLWRVDPGFNPDNVLTLTISLPNNKFDWNHNVTFERDVAASVRTLPGVRDAAAIQGVPMREGGFVTSFAAEGAPATPDLPTARMRVISAGYFRVMQIPLLDGRDFDTRDDAGERGSPHFIIVNRTLASRYWPGESAVGKRLRVGTNSNDWTPIAGVVGDVRYSGLDAPPEMEIYLPDGIFPESAMTLLVKTAGDPLRLVSNVRARIAQVDREAFVSDIHTMDDLIGESLVSRLFATLLLTVCAGIALLLALSGIYGIVSQAAVQRRLEIGIRIALGATPRRVIGLMLQRAASPVVAGAALGLLATIATTRLVSALLFGVQPFDPLTFAGATGAFAAVALIAALIPARRAARVDPLVALRSE
jgi:putative ABC transport system permease protein